jgi:Replication initiator protein A
MEGHLVKRDDDPTWMSESKDEHLETGAGLGVAEPSNESISDFEPTSFAKVEKSLASLGFFTPSSRRIKDQRVKRMSFTREIDGKRVEVSAEILPTIYGLPITADLDKYLALSEIITGLLQARGKIANPIRFTSAELLRMLNKKVSSGKNYKDIVEWLDVMASTTIISNGVVYVAGKKRFVEIVFMSSLVR